MVSSGVVSALGALEVKPSRNVAGTMCERGNLPGTVSPETPITASPACANSPPAGRGKRPATAVNASAQAPSIRTNDQARDAPDEATGGSVVPFTGPRRYTGHAAEGLTTGQTRMRVNASVSPGADWAAGSDEDGVWAESGARFRLAQRKRARPVLGAARS